MRYEFHFLKFAIIFFLQIDKSFSDEYRLVFAHVIYRHGDRAPSGTFPNDKYQEDAWPMGWSQLTPEGVREQYELGTYLRKRYDGFLSANYSREEFYVRSSDRDRALESAQSNLAGLYPLSQKADCGDKANWRPIPVHSVAREDDHILQTDADENCPAYQEVYSQQTTGFIEEMNKKYAGFFAYLKDKTGMKKLDFLKVGRIYGAIQREKIRGWEVPDWADQIWQEESGDTVLDVLAEMKRLSNALEVNTLEKARLMSGFLVGDIVHRLKEKASGKLIRPTKLLMYSAHEGTVGGFLYAINISNDKLVPHAACLIIELHQSISNPTQYFVSIHYRNDSAVEPHPLSTRECSTASSSVYCPLDVFAEGVKPVILYPLSKRFEACGLSECGLPPNGASMRGIPVFTSCATMIIAFLFLFD